MREYSGLQPSACVRACVRAGIPTRGFGRAARTPSPATACVPNGDARNRCDSPEVERRRRADDAWRRMATRRPTARAPPSGRDARKSETLPPPNELPPPARTERRICIAPPALHAALSARTRRDGLVPPRHRSRNPFGASHREAHAHSSARGGLRMQNRGDTLLTRQPRAPGKRDMHKRCSRCPMSTETTVARCPIILRLFFPHIYIPKNR
ncbi:hypothetical protein MTO96_025752 [Rhipicephalus appendiculatus]